MSLLRHVATAAATDALFVTAEFERRVQLWSLAERRLLAEFDTVLDFGGQRLTLVGTVDEPIVIAGAWARHGVCAYGVDGSLLWQRKELKKPQYLSPALDGAVVAAGFESTSLHALDAATGETIAKARGVREFMGGADRSFGVCDLSMEVGLISTSDWKVRWRAPIDGFATLGFAVAPSAVLASVGGTFMSATPDTYVACFDLQGQELWRWICPDQTNVQDLAWDAEAEVWVGFHSAEQPKILRWSTSGELIADLEVGEGADYAFLPSGRGLVSTNGAIYDSRDATITWRYRDA